MYMLSSKCTKCKMHLWECTFVGRGHPRNSLTLIRHEQWWFHWESISTAIYGTVWQMLAIVLSLVVQVFFSYNKDKLFHQRCPELMIMMNTFLTWLEKRILVNWSCDFKEFIFVTKSAVLLLSLDCNERNLSMECYV